VRRPTFSNVVKSKQNSFEFYWAFQNGQCSHDLMNLTLLIVSWGKVRLGLLGALVSMKWEKKFQYLDPNAQYRTLDFFLHKPQKYIFKVTACYSWTPTLRLEPEIWNILSHILRYSYSSNKKSFLQSFWTISYGVIKATSINCIFKTTGNCEVDTLSALYIKRIYII